MSEDERIKELADEIYSEWGIQIRYCDCFIIAKKLIELGYENKLNDESQKEIHL